MTTVTQTNRLLRLERLVQVCSQLNLILELEPMLQAIVQAASELTGSEASSIFLLEEETGLLKFAAAPHSHWATLRLLRVPLVNSVAGECYRSGLPVIKQPQETGAGIFRQVDEALSFTTHSIYAAPLVYQHQVIGVLEAINKHSETGQYLDYDEDDGSVLALLAAHAATAIHSMQLQDENRRSQQELAELERRKEDFISVTSHELRTPLGLILGYAGILQETMLESDQQAQIQVIVKSTLRLKKLIDDLQALNEEQAGQNGMRRKRFDLIRLADEVVATFEALAGRRRVALYRELPEAPLTVVGDAEKIAIALSNLLKNALIYTDPGGHVVLSAESLPGFVKVSVSDDGIGIPTGDLHRVFERFYRVEAHMDRKHRGMGLGLSVAKVMVELHGGQIWVESIEGRGSTFSFLLPAARTNGRPKSL